MQQTWDKAHHAMVTERGPNPLRELIKGEKRVGDYCLLPMILLKQRTTIRRSRSINL